MRAADGKSLMPTRSGAMWSLQSVVFRLPKLEPEDISRMLAGLTARGTLALRRLFGTATWF